MLLLDCSCTAQRHSLYSCVYLLEFYSIMVHITPCFKVKSPPLFSHIPCSLTSVLLLETTEAAIVLHISFYWNLGGLLLHQLEPGIPAYTYIKSQPYVIVKQGIVQSWPCILPRNIFHGLPACVVHWSHLRLGYWYSWPSAATPHLLCNMALGPPFLNYPERELETTNLGIFIAKFKGLASFIRLPCKHF